MLLVYFYFCKKNALSKNIQAHLALLAVALIYGSNYSIAKEVMPTYIQPFGLILLRGSSGVLLFWLLHRLFVRERVDKKDYKMLFICSIFGVTVNQMCFFVGLNWTTPINASLIMILVPMLVLIVSAFVLGERMTFQKILGILIGCIGASVLIAYGRNVAFSSNGWIGDLFILINATSYAIYLVIVKPLMEKYHPLTVVKWLFTFGVIVMIPFGWNDLMAVDWASIPVTIWIAIAFIIVCVTVMTFLFNGFALGIVNPSVVSIYIYLQPLVASVIALSLGKDELSQEKILAGILIFIGVFMVSRPLNKKPA